MLFNLYSVRDRVANEFGPIFQAKNDDVAWRNYFSLLTNSNVTDMLDYELVRLGSFDVDTGKIELESSLTAMLPRFDPEHLKKKPKAPPVPTEV
ncbi:MAG: hypothetical protein Ta2B_10630 [Termitinemataceae bacterium]|nr:MAG: hypothetical protein Ta2B_10630 [Termitinemataceae bacterium]